MRSRDIGTYVKEVIYCQLRDIILMEDGMKQKKALHDEIAKIAYEFYKTRNMANGHDLDDWLMAEQIVTEKHERHAKETGQEVDIFRKGAHVHRG